MSYAKIELDGAAVVVTGGARGIGKATADLFAAKGATVCIGDLDGAEGPNGYAVDVTSRDSSAEFIGAVLDRFGRIDILVNNAGVMPLADFLSEGDAISRTTLDVNVWGLIHGMRLVLPHMIERGSGHVVNVASMAGKLVVPGMAVYNASKFVAVGLSAAVREEYRDAGVSVTAVLPSAVRTRLASGVPLGHGVPTVDPEDVARAIAGSGFAEPADSGLPAAVQGRQVVSASYYRALRARNAELVTDAIERITPRGIRTADGREIDVDLLVFATGFQAHNYMRPMNLRGRDGVSIDDARAKGPRAYRMTAIPGFPNFFTVLGPTHRRDPFRCSTPRS
jgi:NADP-dependent 3-hydroxy acid dehydrogenase YdfG